MNEEVSRDMTGEADGKNQGVDSRDGVMTTSRPVKVVCSRVDDNRLRVILRAIQQTADQATLFMPRDAMHKRGLCRRAVTVSPSVLLFVKFVHCTKTSNHIFKLFSRSDSHAVLVFS